MMWRSIVSLAILGLLSLVQAATLTGSLQGGVPVSTGARVVLDHGASSALINRHGGFSLYDVEEGEHVLSVQMHGWAYPSLLITVPTSGDPHVQIHHPSRLPVPTSSPSLPYPIALHALGKEDYYTSKTGVNILAMLKSPMVLMMLASGVMMFVLPKIMASVEADPEMKKEMAEARKMMSGAGVANMLKGASAEAPKATTGPKRRK